MAQAAQEVEARRAIAVAELHDGAGCSTPLGTNSGDQLAALW